MSRFIRFLAFKMIFFCRFIFKKYFHYFLLFLIHLSIISSFLSIIESIMSSIISYFHRNMSLISLIFISKYIKCLLHYQWKTFLISLNVEKIASSFISSMTLVIFINLLEYQEKHLFINFILIIIICWIYFHAYSSFDLIDFWYFKHKITLIL